MHDGEGLAPARESGAPFPASVLGTPFAGTRSMRFGQYYVGAFTHPRRTFAALAQDPSPLAIGARAFAVAMFGYVVVYVCLVFGHGRPTVFHPWLAIDPEVYYRWNVLFVAPSMIMAWLLAGAVMQLAARAFGGRGSFESTLAVLGLGIGVASWATMLHDIVTAFLGAIHVIDQRAYEDAMSSPTPFRTLLYVLMFVYLVAFVGLFALGARAVHGVGRGRAAALGLLGFAVYQLVFVLFNR